MASGESSASSSKMIEGELSEGSERERIIQLFTEAQTAISQETDRREVIVLLCACVKINFALSIQNIRCCVRELEQD